MSAPGGLNVHNLEDLYRIAIKDNLEKVVNTKNAEDIRTLRQCLTALDGCMAELRGTMNELRNDNQALRKTNEEFRLVIDELRTFREQSVIDKKTMTILQTHILQVDHRQSELENRLEPVEAAFEQTFQAPEAEASISPEHFDNARPLDDSQATTAEYQPVDQLFQFNNDISMSQRHDEPMLHTPGHDSQNSETQSPEEQPRWRAVKERQQQQKHRKFSRESPGIEQSEDEDEREASEPTDVNLRMKAFLDHYKDTKSKYANAGKMGKRAERQFVWSFIDGIKDEEASIWFQNVLLENLPSNMVHIRKGHRSARLPGRRIVALTSDVTWEAVVRRALKHVKIPSFFA